MGILFQSILLLRTGWFYSVLVHGAIPDRTLLPLTTSADDHRLHEPVQKTANHGKADEDDRNYDRKNDCLGTLVGTADWVALHTAALNTGWFSTSETGHSQGKSTM